MLSTSKDYLEDVVEGVRQTLGVLRDSDGGGATAHATAGESAGVIGLLGVSESDAANNLAINATEKRAATTH